VIASGLVAIPGRADSHMYDCGVYYNQAGMERYVFPSPVCTEYNFTHYALGSSDEHRPTLRAAFSLIRCTLRRGVMD
jgi:hypothetical protein